MPALILVVTVLAVAAMALNSKGGDASQTQISGLLQSASLARNSGDYEQAAMLYERALSLIESARRVDESLLSECLVNFADVLDKAGERAKAEGHRKRLLAIWNNALDSGNSELMTEVDYLCSNATFGAQTKDVADYYERLLAAREKTHAPGSDVFINTVVIYARLMRALGEKEIASDLEAHAENLRKGGGNTLENSPAPEVDPEQPEQ